MAHVRKRLMAGESYIDSGGCGQDEVVPLAACLPRLTLVGFCT